MIALQADGTPPPVSRDHASLRPQARRAAATPRAATVDVLLRLRLRRRAESAHDARPRSAPRRWPEPSPGAARVARIVTASQSEAEAFLQSALDRGHEGVMAKALGAPYFAGSRGESWLKLKSSHTLDLVVLAAEWGSGRRTGLLSNLHLGARDAEQRRLRDAGQDLQGTHRRAACARRPSSCWRARRGATATRSTCDPSWWWRSRSTMYRPARTIRADVALRFARVKRYRPDKQASEADTIEQVRALHRRTGAAEESPDSGSHSAK